MLITSGSAEDLEVVESILLRLDSEGFAERITEVIWLRNNDAELIATAITNYVNARQQSQTAIQQYQQGLGPFDLLDRDVIAVPEINSNSILLSVAPQMYEEVRRLIDRLDRRRATPISRSNGRTEKTWLTQGRATGNTQYKATRSSFNSIRSAAG